MIESERARIEKKGADNVRELKDQLAEMEVSMNRQITDLKAKVRASEDELSKA